MEQDRRQPLGGISRETFVNASDERHYRQLEYDILSCIDSKIQRNANEILKINNKCPAECIIDFDRRYLKKVHERIPMSLYELVAYCLVLGGFFALSYLYYDKIPTPPLPFF